MWLYQDFVAGSGPNLTISQNDNGTGISFDSTRIVNNSAVVTTEDGNPIYNSATHIPANEVEVNSHIGDAVVLTGTPDVGEGVVRVWYLYAVQSSDDTTDVEIAPHFVKAERTEFLDFQYLNSLLNLSDLNDVATARTNLGFTSQTAGRVLYSDGATYTSEANLFWDATNDRLGIGTSSPSERLHVRNDAASAVTLLESQFTGGVPELRLQAARTSNADLATNDDLGALSFYGRYNSTTGLLAQIYGEYTGSGTTQLGDLVFTTANAGSPAERMRVAASGRVTVQTSLAANTSVITPIVYGSESASGDLILRSTSNATVGNILIGDQTGENTVIGPTGSATTPLYPVTVLTPTTNALTNSFVIHENSADMPNGRAVAGPQGFQFITKDIDGSVKLFTRVNGFDVGEWSIYRATDGELLGQMDFGAAWGVRSTRTGVPAFRVSGYGVYTANLTEWYSSTSYANLVSSVGSGGQFRGPAGVVGTPGFAFQGDTNNGWWAPAADTQAWSLAGAEAMRLNSSGLLLKTALVIEDPGAGTNTVTINTGTVSSSYTMTLPLAQGAAGTTLVNNGSGVLSWASPNAHKAGAVSLSNGDTSKAITFTTAWGDANYTPWVSLRNTVDGSPIALAYRVIAKSTTGFTVEWDDAISGSNYSLDWGAIDHYDP